MNMFGSFLPSLGRHATKFTQVKGADIVMKSDTGLVLWVSVTALPRAYRAGLPHDLKEDLLNRFSLYGRCLVARVVHESYDARGEQAIDTEPIPASTLEPATQPFQRHESGEKCAESPQEDWPHSGCDTRATA